VPMAIELALASDSRWRQVLWWAGAAVLVLAVIGTQSRGGTLGLVAVMGYLWLRSPYKLLISSVALVLVAVILVYAPDEYFGRMQTIRTFGDGSAQGRITAWKAAVQMFLHNPVLGVGAGNFPTAFGTEFQQPDYRGWLTAHSMYFLVLGELGLPGAVVLGYLVLGNLRQNRRVAAQGLVKSVSSSDHSAGYDSSRMLILLSASVIGLAVPGAFLSVAYYPHLFVLTALLVSARRTLIDKMRSPGVNRERPARRTRAPTSRTFVSTGSNECSRYLRIGYKRGKGCGPSSDLGHTYPWSGHSIARE
jgi:probable O-glycosylation ligase (exosortase A-associated)